MECPIGLDRVHCESCHFWRDGKCAHDEIIQETEASKTVETIRLSLTKSQLIVVGFLVGQLLAFMACEGLSEVSLGYQEVADLVDKLTDAIGSVSGEVKEG